jgi:hypothetical protein
MNIIGFEKLVNIEPDISFKILWFENNSRCIIDFNENLLYNTSYILTIYNAQAISGSILKDWPFNLTFKTELKKVMLDVVQSVRIIYPKENTIFKPGERINITGVTENLTSGTLIIIELNGQKLSDSIDVGGSWKIEVKLPMIEGNYTIKVIVGNLNDSVNIIIIEDEVIDGDEDVERDKCFFGFGEIFDYLIIILIIVIIMILILIIVVLRKKQKKSIEKEIEEFEGESESKIGDEE